MAAPVLVVVCEFFDQSRPRVPRSLSLWSRLFWDGKGPTKGVESVYVMEMKVGYPVAKNPDELKTLVVILRDVSDFGEVLEYLLIDWPTLDVCERKEIEPYYKKVDKYPGRLKPFWKDTSFAYYTKSFPDWEKCSREVANSLAAKIRTTRD